MKNRCYNEKTEDFCNYGGRGITICSRWLASFNNFFADVGLRPSADHSLDRFPNNNGNYEPGNVRWATRSQQASNRREDLKRAHTKKTDPSRVEKIDGKRPVGRPRAMSHCMKCGYKCSSAREALTHCAKKVAESMKVKPRAAREHCK